MKLKALDQMHISAVQRDTLRPGQVFEISDAAGEELLKKHPSKFVCVESGAKAEQPPRNKAEGGAPANKAANKGGKRGRK